MLTELFDVARTLVGFVGVCLAETALLWVRFFAHLVNAFVTYLPAEAHRIAERYCNTTYPCEPCPVVARYPSITPCPSRTLAAVLTEDFGAWFPIVIIGVVLALVFVGVGGCIGDALATAREREESAKKERRRQRDLRTKFPCMNVWQVADALDLVPTEEQLADLVKIVGPCPVVSQWKTLTLEEYGRLRTARKRPPSRPKNAPWKPDSPRRRRLPRRKRWSIEIKTAPDSLFN